MPYTKQTWPNAVMGDSVGARMNYAEQGIATAQATAEAASTLYLPPGVMLPYAAATAPTGYLLCDGSAVSRATYAALFSVIGTTYGAGDGSTTFNVPDMKCRTIVGAGVSAGLTTRANGDTGGAESVTLTAAQSGLPGHAHTMAHTHTVNVQETTATSNAGLSAGATNRSVVPNDSTLTNLTTAGASRTSGGSSAANTGTVAAANASSSHENMPPFVVATYIIKT